MDGADILSQLESEGQNWARISNSEVRVMYFSKARCRDDPSAIEAWLQLSGTSNM